MKARCYAPNYVIVREWAAKRMSTRVFNIYRDEPKTEYYHIDDMNLTQIINHSTAVREIFDNIKTDATLLRWDDFTMLGSNPGALPLIREFIEAFDVFDKYVAVSNVKDWDNMTIMNLLEQLITPNEWEKIQNFPTAAFLWWHQEESFLIDGLSTNPAIATYDYQRIADDRKELLAELRM
jgi:hypothetical protein